MLVQENFISSRINQIHYSDCESICVKVNLQPIPLVLYLAYVNEPEMDILLKHLSLYWETTI